MLLASHPFEKFNHRFHRLPLEWYRRWFNQLHAIRIGDIEYSESSWVRWGQLG